jgi:hypothetical protein
MTEQLGKRKTFLTTMEIDLAAYSRERDLFLNDYFAFQQGHFNAGSMALTHLLAMYYILPMMRHMKLSEEDSNKFLDDVSKLQTELREYLEKKRISEQGKIIDNDLLLKMGIVVRNFYKILSGTGYLV